MPEMLVGAGGELSASCLHGRITDRLEARLRPPVRVVGARLPAVQVGLVDQVEEDDPDDGRLADGELEGLPIVLGLRGLVDRVEPEWRLEVRVGALGSL